MNEDFYQKDFEKREKNIFQNKLMTTKDFLKKIESWEKKISWRFDFYESCDLLKGKEFEGVIFKNCEFLYWDFSGSIFEDCTFKNVMFYRSNMKLLRFEKCDMDESDFQNVYGLPVFLGWEFSYTSITEAK